MAKYDYEEMLKEMPWYDFTQNDVRKITGCGNYTCYNFIEKQLDAGNIIKISQRKYRTTLDNSHYDELKDVIV